MSRPLLPRKTVWASMELLLLIALPLVFFGRLLVAGRILLLRDLVNIWCGYQSFYRDTLLEGALPLWQPYSGCGEPFLADPQSATLYPLSLIFLLFPLAEAQVLGVTLHILMAGVGTFALSRLWGISRTGSLVAAIAFSFSALLLSRVEFYAVMATTCWFPVTMAIFTWWARRPSVSRILTLAVTLAVQLLAGYPEAFVYSTGALILYAICLTATAWSRARNRQEAFSPLLAVLLACLLAGLLTMAQILPSWEAQQVSQRAAMDPELDKASFHPLMLCSLVFPYLYGTLGLVGRYWAPSCYEYWIGAIYVGILPVVILLATGLHRFVSILRPSVPTDREDTDHRAGSIEPRVDAALACPSYLRRAAVLTLVGLVVLSFLYSMGKYTPFFRLVWTAVPILQKFRWPTKSLMCFSLSVSCLSAFALDFLTREADRTQRMADRLKTHHVALVLTFLVSASLSVLALVCLADNGTVGEKLLRACFNLGAISPENAHHVEWPVLGRECVKLAITLPLTVLTLVLYIHAHRRRRILGGLMACLLFADLSFSSMPILPTADKSVMHRTRETDGPYVGIGSESRFFKNDPLVEFWIYGIRDPEVFHCLRECLVKHWSIVDHAFSLPQETSFQPSHVGQVLGILYDNRVPSESRKRLLSMLNCGTTLVYPDTFDYLTSGQLAQPQVLQLQAPLPRAFVVGGVEVLNTPEEVLGTLAFGDFDPLAVAYTDQASIGSHRFYGLGRGHVDHKLSRLAYFPNGIELDMTTAAPGVLVLTDTWFPGWGAEVNGQSTDIFRVNGGFRGLEVPAGECRITMRYRPFSFSAGLAVSLLTLLCGLILAATPRFHQRIEERFFRNRTEIFPGR